jgi:Cu/Ag efflux protein CusF
MTNRSNRHNLLIGLLTGLSTLALAGGLARAEAPSGPSTARQVHETTVVTAIDRTTRSVTLENSDGETRTVGVPPDMKSFDTLKVGDHVDVDYYESIALAMMPPGTKSTMSERTTGGRVQPGVVAAGREVTATVQVVGVDEAMNKITFKGPKGNLRTVTVYDPAMQKKLASLQPGQMVQISYREAIAASIKPTPAAK